jgi:hypothetical protein
VPSRDDDRRGGSTGALDVGTLVEADYRGKGKFFSGKISRVRLNGTYDVDYDDGEKEMMVAKDLIRAKSSGNSRNDSKSSELEVGAAVEADYRGRGKFYSGKIARVRPNGTYDVDFDDGEKEMGVPRDLIKPKSGYGTL